MTSKENKTKNFRVELLKKIHQDKSLTLDERCKFISLIYDLEYQIFEENFLLSKNDDK
ncbi:MAG: hypothetical protein ACRDD4_13205 [Culicoidibacterales bacterium]